MEVKLATHALRQYRKLTPGIKKDILAGLTVGELAPGTRGSKVCRAAMTIAFE